MWNLMLNLLMPECILFSGVIATLCYALKSKPKAKILHYITQLALWGALFASLTLPHLTHPYAFPHDLFVVDQLVLNLNPMILLSSILVFTYGHKTLAKMAVPQEAFYVLGLLSILGMLCLTASANMISLFVSLELMSLPIYALTALNRTDRLSVEASFKYFLTGAVASIMILYGFSFLYGLSGHLSLPALFPAAQTWIGTSAQWEALFAIILIASGIAFKFGLAPFHMWVPDVFEGVPTPITLFLMTAPKLATFAFLVRLLADALAPLSALWQPVFMLMAIISIAWGNLMALQQDNIKRLLAYSSVAHMGYLFLGIIAVQQSGYNASLLYLLVYILTTLATLAAVIMLEDRTSGKMKTLDDLCGLHHKDPALALVLLLCLFSLTGLPPIVGFMAKFNIFVEVIKAHHVALSVYAILFTAVGAFYYIRIIRNLYFQPESTQVLALPKKDLGYYTLVCNAFAILGFGFFPALLIGWAHIA